MKLEFKAPNGDYNYYEVGLTSFTVGRSRKCDITLSDESISREHLKVHVLDDGDASVEDLGSSNGTRLNGVRLDGKMPQPFSSLFPVELGNGIMMRMMEANESFPEDAHVIKLAKQLPKELISPKVQSQRSIKTNVVISRKYQSPKESSVKKSQNNKSQLLFKVIVLVALALAADLYFFDSK